MQQRCGCLWSAGVAGGQSPRASLSKLEPLPPIPAASGGGASKAEDELRNPFVMPPESELFTLRERQRREARELRAEQRKLKVHQKSTYSSRLNAKNAALRKTVCLKPEKISTHINKHTHTGYVTHRTPTRQRERERQ